MDVCTVHVIHLPLRIFSCCLYVFHNQHIYANIHNNMGSELEMHRMLHEQLQCRSFKEKKN